MLSISVSFFRRVRPTLPLSFTRAASLSSSSFRLFALGVAIATPAASPSFFTRLDSTRRNSTRPDPARLASPRLDSTRLDTTLLDSTVLGRSFSSSARIHPFPSHHHGFLLSPLSFSLSLSSALGGIARLRRSCARLLRPSLEPGARQRERERE